ncbi:hypothetical protein LF1_11770 [Rubripirellula obstinata]|uniref:Uncharacterized protein n=1 Tax=Rubripirellula obstinata TaxID=406547 RepID=A0A5B1CFG5_9BACT|nr:hypothetical protein [Rubripirellula obstinata]KAA1258655.1 hypothetical protein LF1_11770 [Rubripirellula obstinata]
MSQVHIQFRHQAFSRDAGMRTNDDAARTNVDSTRTGVLTDEYESSSDQVPLLVEDVSGRVYRAADLPLGTEIVIPEAAERHADLVDRAKRSGFQIR